ncbi:MAG: hypothetical protein QOH46_4129 [Solirubrobacteraceae bacterium]|nr:hypothetical protein [Solirubrobacteraceae bacterium]
MTAEALGDVAAAAGRIIVALEAGRHREAREQAQELNAAVHRASQTSGRDAVVAALRVRTSAMAGLAARRAPALALAETANRVRDLVAEQAELHADPAIAAVLRLDYLEREVELRSLAGQHAAAGAAARAVADVWTGARATVAVEPLAARFDDHVAHLQQLRGPSLIEEEARRGLELVALLSSSTHTAGARSR